MSETKIGIRRAFPQNLQSENQSRRELCLEGICQKFGNFGMRDDLKR